MTVIASTSRSSFHTDHLRRITMTVASTIDAAGWLGKYLENGDVDSDLPRAMLGAFAEALMSAQASLQCGAGYGERSEERENSRNGIGTGGGIPGWGRSSWRCRSCAVGCIRRSSC